MRHSGKIKLILIFACAAGLVSFLVTRIMDGGLIKESHDPMQSWLEVSKVEAQELGGLDPDFSKETADMKLSLMRTQLELATLLEDAVSSDKKIMSQVEKILELHETLRVRVVKHVLAIRKMLPDDKQQQLSGLCSFVLRGPVGGRGRGYHGGRGGGFKGGGDHPGRPPMDGRGRGGRGRGFGGGRDDIMGQGRGGDMVDGRGGRMMDGRGRQEGRGRRDDRGPGGRGMGDGRGGRQGRGRGMDEGYGGGRRGRGFGPHIGMTVEQEQAVYKLDPDYGTQSYQLGIRVHEEHYQLAMILEDFGATDDQVMTQMKKLIQAQKYLDLRTAKHVLLVRKHLTSEQQKRLVGLCSQRGRGRDGGHGRGRHMDYD